MKDSFLYRMISKNDLTNVFKYGLLSPYQLYRDNDEIFLKNLEFYKNRAKNLLKKQIKTSEDILEYLDKRDKYLNSHSQYFNVLSIAELANIKFLKILKDIFENNVIEFKLPIDLFKGYNKYIVNKKKVIKATDRDIVKLKQLLMNKVNKKKFDPPKTGLLFSEIPHIAVQIDKIKVTHSDISFIY